MKESEMLNRRQVLRRLGALGAALPLASVVAACSAAPTAAPQPTVSGQPGSAPAATAQAGPASAKPAGAAGSANAELEKIIEGAKAEGTVVAIGNTIAFEETRQALTEGFRAKYGLPATFKFQYIEKAIGEVTKQVEEEIRAGKVSVDVPFANNSAWFKDLAEKKLLLAYDAPSYEAYKDLDSKPGFNNRPYYVSDIAVTVNLVWNREIIKEDFKSWFDLLKPQYSGQISVGSARLASTWAIAYKAMRESPDIGNKFFQELAKLKPATVNRSEVQVDKAISGEYPICIGGATRPYSYWKLKGVNSLGQVFPKEGVVPLQNAAAVLKDAPHPNAGRLFVDFLRSREGQQILVDFEGRITTRTDVKKPATEYIPDIKDLKLLYVDTTSISENEFRTLGDDWVGIFGA